MGKSSPSPPPAPDPVQTAQAQTQSNVQSAVAQSMMNRVNQYGPDGSITYTPTGSYNDGGTEIPLFSQTTSLSPAEQQLYNLTKQAQTEYGQAAVNQIGKAAGQLSSPMTAPNAGASPWATQQADNALGMAINSIRPLQTNFDNVRNQSLAAGWSRLNPELKMQQESLNSRLLGQGVTQGSEAWNNAQRQFANQENDAFEQNILNAESLTGQAVQQQGALSMQPIQEAAGLADVSGNVVNQAGATLQQAGYLRDLPLNEASVLLNGGQVQMPQFQQVPSTNVAPTDVIGATMGSYNGQMQGYNQRVAQQSANQGGMYALGGTALMAGAILI